jgi:hypothetical protein
LVNKAKAFGTSQFTQLKGLEFTEPNTIWKNFTLGNRSGTLPPHGHDYVSGPVLRGLKSGSAWPYPEYNQTSLHSEDAAQLFNKNLRP